MFLEIEAGLAILALVLALTVPNVGSRWFEAVERSFGKLARQRGFSVITVGLSALVLRLALIPILPIPIPLVPDEFGYLLGADTFAHGRLANPTPLLWTHFESLMILLKPSYSSQYPPAQSLFLAMGQVLLGHPFWGVWLSAGLMCAAICWMLQVWVGEGWALLGGFLAVARIAAFSYWDNSYWGGAVAALGGALALGALPRLKQEHRVRNALVMGLGLAILANSRPYEGFVFSLPVAVALVVWMVGRKRPAFSVSFRQMILPLCLLLGLVAVWMGYYNWRVGGDPLKLPYQIVHEQYDRSPYFLWESEQPLPEYRHPEMKEYEVDSLINRYEGTRSPAGLAMNELEKVSLMWLFFVGPLFTLLFVVAFVTLPYGFSSKDISPPSKFLLAAFGVSLAAVGLEVYFCPHYAAPLTCIFFALELLAMRRIRGWRLRGKPAGLFLVRSVPVIFLLLLLLRAGVAPLHLEPKYGLWTPWFSNRARTSTIGRTAILSELEKQPGRQLVLVRYSPTLYDLSAHPTGKWPPDGVFEWVYNGADIDGQRVIWAHDMGPAENEELIQYYKGRQVWLLFADDQPPKLVPYSEAAVVSPAGPVSTGK